MQRKWAMALLQEMPLNADADTQMLSRIFDSMISRGIFNYKANTSALS